MESRSRTARVRLKPIALPAEHGSWGFLLEPILLGLALAPGWAGFGLALAVASAFLIRNPIRVFLRARRNSAGSPRFMVARRVALAYAAVAVIGLAACVLVAGLHPLWPLVAVSPLAALFIYLDGRNRGRSLAAELTGPVGLAAAAASIVLADGWSDSLAVVVWAVVLLKAWPTVVYIRARLRLEDGDRVSPIPSGLLHVAAVAVSVVLWRVDLLPPATVVALALLAVRGVVGLTGMRWGRTPKQIGIAEFVIAGLYVIATAAGFRLN